MKYIAIILLVAGVACSGPDNNARQEALQAIPVTTWVVKSSSADYLELSGEVVAAQAAPISTRIMGYVAFVPVKTGDRVQRGQLLVSIQNQDLEAKIGQAKAMVAEGEAAFSDATKDHDRYQILYAQQSVSQKELEQVTLGYLSAKSRLEAAKKMLAEAEAMSAYTRLRAPFSGVVTQVYADAGAMASPGMPLVVVEQENNFEIRTSASAQQIASITKGAEVLITLKTTGGILKGRVEEISPSATFSGGRYPIIISVSATAGLYAGMTVGLRLGVKNESHARASVTIPLNAVHEKEQLQAVFIVNDQHAALLRYIRTGRKEGDRVEVISGLVPGEKIVIEANGKLFNGVRVLEQ